MDDSVMSYNKQRGVFRIVRSGKHLNRLINLGDANGIYRSGGGLGGNIWAYVGQHKNC